MIKTVLTDMMIWQYLLKKKEVLQQSQNNSLKINFENQLKRTLNFYSPKHRILQDYKANDADGYGNLCIFFKSPQSGVTLCFQFISAASTTAATSATATTFASHIMAKPFQLRYLPQRIYGSGEMYWMTFLWPWPKVTAVASISKNLLVCAIKW